jgi:hypothetical protein
MCSAASNRHGKSVGLPSVTKSSSPLVFLAAFSFLPACSGDATEPELPAFYRWTLQTTDPNHPARVFSASVDWRQGFVAVGMNGTGFTTGMIKSGDTWLVPFNGALQEYPLPLTPSQPFASEHGAAGDELVISALSLLRPADAGCAGVIAASVSHGAGVSAGLRSSYDVSPGLFCFQDRVGPAFAATSETATLNPVDLRRLLADEALANVSAASLTDAVGNSIDVLAPLGPRSLGGESSFGVSATLAFGTTYTLAASGTDLAGNANTSSSQLTTDPDPGLFAQDGFEGPINAARTGVTVLDASKPASAGGLTLPIPSGQKALAFTKVWSGMAYSRFTARMQAPVGATAVKVTYVRYRGKAPDATSPVVTYPESHIVWTVGVSNSNAIAVYDKDQPPVTAVALPWIVEPAAQGATGWYSVPQTLSFPLPGTVVGGEVIFDVVTDAFTSSGDGAFILDDLRVE